MIDVRNKHLAKTDFPGFPGMAFLMASSLHFCCFIEVPGGAAAPEALYRMNRVLFPQLRCNSRLTAKAKSGIRVYRPWGIRFFVLPKSSEKLSPSAGVMRWTSPSGMAVLYDG